MKTWLWQLSYAVLGLCFFVGLIFSVYSLGTNTFHWWVGFALASIVLLIVLNRVIHGRRRRPGCPQCGYSRAGLPTGAPCPERGANTPPIAADSTDSPKVP